MDSQSGALANIIELARLSRLTLLYHGAAASAADGGREQAAALASAAAAAANGDVVVLFDAGSDLPVPDLLADIEAAVLEAAPHAPLAPPMAGPVEALAFWQQALGVRFMVIMQRFDQALSRPDPEFDALLPRLAHDTPDISVLLLMEEAAAPLLQRLRDALPELGETFLRLPEPAGMAPAPPEQAREAAWTAPPAAPATQFGPAPFLLDDPDDEAAGQTVQNGEEQGEMTLPAARQPETGQEGQHEEQYAQHYDGQHAKQPGEQPEEQGKAQRRSRRFSSLLEQARIAPDAFDAPAGAPPEALEPGPPVDFVFPAAPAEQAPEALPPPIFPAAGPATFAAPDLTLPDGRAEPSFHAARSAASAVSATTARVYRERRPMQVAAWMQKRRSRRRRGTVGMASRVASSSAVLFVLMAVLAVLGWQMPQLGPSAGAVAPRAAAQAHQTMAVRGNR